MSVVLRPDVTSLFWVLIGIQVPIHILHADWAKMTITRWTGWSTHIIQHNTGYKYLNPRTMAKALRLHIVTLLCSQILHKAVNTILVWITSFIIHLKRSGSSYSTSCPKLLSWSHPCYSAEEANLKTMHLTEELTICCNTHQKDLSPVRSMQVQVQ